MGVENYDILVIGTGKSGSDVANACADEGWKVAVADNREYGGVCANRGCDPKKVLASFTEILYRSQNMVGKGINQLPEVSWEALQQFKHQFTDAVPFVTERSMKEKGITLYHQSPKFLTANTLSIEGKTISAKKIVIASGQKTRPLFFKGAQHLLISDDFLELEHLPKSMIFVGGGYIGMEFAHIAARFGVKVTVIHSHKRPLNNFDPDMVDELVKVSQGLGIKFLFNAHVKRLEKISVGYKVYADQSEKEIAATAELVFNATGRVPSLEDLDLDKGGVSFSKKGVEVNENLQNPKNKNVYACGDVAASPGLPLTPLAPFESSIVITHLLDKKEKKKAIYPDIPSVVFTLPNVSNIGLSQEEAEKKFKHIKIYHKEATDWYSAKHIHDPVYAYKIITHSQTKKILGAHLIGSQASEMINIIAFAMANDLTMDAFQKTLFAYPTWGRDLQSMLQ